MSEKSTMELACRVDDLESRLSKAVEALEKVIWAVNVAMEREGSSESKVRIGGIVQEALAAIKEEGEGNE